jgi:hypothetical protein
MAMWLAVALTAACGTTTVHQGDAAPVPVDAAPPDAEPPDEVRAQREIVSGGARVGGGTMTVDVEIGHAFAQQRATGGSLTLEGAAAVKRKPGSTHRQKEVQR